MLELFRWEFVKGLWERAVADFQYSYVVMWAVLLFLLLMVFWDVYDRYADARFLRNEQPQAPPHDPAATVRLPETTVKLTDDRWSLYGPRTDRDEDRFV